MKAAVKDATSAFWSAPTRSFGRKGTQQPGIVTPVLDRPERCTNCRLQALYGRMLCGVCHMICPDQAISWVEEKPFEPHRVEVEF